MLFQDKWKNIFEYIYILPPPNLTQYGIKILETWKKKLCQYWLCHYLHSTHSFDWQPPYVGYAYHKKEILRFFLASWFRISHSIDICKMWPLPAGDRMLLAAESHTSTVQSVFKRVTEEACSGFVGNTLMGRSHTMVSTSRVAGPRHWPPCSAFAARSCALDIADNDVTNSKCSRQRWQTENIAQTNHLSYTPL